MEGPAMSLSAWEQQTLDSIKDGLTGSDPQLAALLTTFTRLASGEAMPAQEEIPVGSPRPRPRPGRRRAGTRRRARPAAGYVRLQWFILIGFLVTTAVLITVALVVGRGGGQGTCTGVWPTMCSPHSPPG
jgi:Protein of unknown function (DUF3040)